MPLLCKSCPKKNLEDDRQSKIIVLYFNILTHNNKDQESQLPAQILRQDKGKVSTH